MQQLQIDTRLGPLTIVPECPPPRIEQLGIDEGLGFFWHNRPDLQKQALVKIAGIPGGRVALAHSAAGVIVGYVTITLPEPDERWGRDQIPGLYELGGIEVSRSWRGAGVGKSILQAVFPPEAYARDIVIATGYRWCWDIESAGLTVREYRNMLNMMFSHYGFRLMETDEPNIAWYPDNALVVRIGPQVSPQLLARFQQLLFERPGSDYLPGEFMR